MAVIGHHISGYSYSDQELNRADMAPRVPGIVSGTEYLFGTTGKIRQNRYEELGLPLGGCSLGSLISDGFENCLLHPYKLFPCMMILVALMLACNLVADGLKDAFDYGAGKA